MIKKILFFVIILVIGIMSGYWYRGSGESRVIVKSDESGSTACQTKTVDSASREKMLLKMDLLRDYINFVNLPPAEIKDPNQYVNNMGTKVDAIADEKIREKYLATGDDAHRDRNILEFFNYVIDDVKDGLK